MTTRPAPPRGISLIEVLVAVGIILFLAGLMVTGITAVLRASERRTTETHLALLDLATGTWERSAGRKLARRAAPGAELDPATEELFIVSEVVRAIERDPDARSILASIDPDAMPRYRAGEIPPWIRSYDEELAIPQFDGVPTVLDAWGVPIYATHPGELAPPGAPADEDGTERTENERAYGVALSRRVCFVSAGPDGLFGLRTEFPGVGGEELRRRIVAAQQDNLYSYQPLLLYAP